MTRRAGLDFSFSGLKTAVVDALRDQTPGAQMRADAAWAFQEAVVDTLAIKCKRALKQTGHERLIVAGGVGANRRLRERLNEEAGRLRIQVHYPRPEFCTDNGAMIAHAGALRVAEGEHLPESIAVHPRWSLEDLQPPVARAA